MNDNYWKDRYSSSWETASDRERQVRDRIQSLTGEEVEFVGLGAGSKEYLSGSAASYGIGKGEADLAVIGTNIRLEVTGPNIRMDQSRPLWIRPDKIQAARNSPEHDTWVVHCSHDNKLLRAIHLNKSFYMFLDRNDFKLIHPRIRGTVENYFEIPASHDVVQPFSSLIDHINDLAKG